MLNQRTWEQEKLTNSLNARTLEHPENMLKFTQQRPLKRRRDRSITER